MASGTIKNKPPIIQYDVDFLPSAVDNHSTKKATWCNGIYMWDGWLHASANIAANTRLFRIKSTSLTFQTFTGIAFQGGGGVQLLRLTGNSSGNLEGYIDQQIPSGQYWNFVLWAVLEL